MYFKNFPELQYNNKALSNILIKSNAINLFKNSYFLENYYLKDEDTPENISYRLYGVPDYSWAILMINDLYNREYDWPLHSKKLDEYIEDKYNYSCVFFLDSKISFIFSDVVKINSFDVKSFDRDLNKFNLTSKTLQINKNNYVNLYNKNNEQIISIKPDRVVYEGSQALNRFELNNEIISPRNIASNSISYINGYINGYVNPLIESAVITNSSNEHKLNDAKRNIVYLKKEYISAFTTAIQNELIKTKNMSITNE